MSRKFASWICIVISNAVFAFSEVSNLSHAHKFSVERLGHPIDPTESSMGPLLSEKDKSYLLSEYCDMDCGTKEANQEPSPYFCWVPSVGELAVVPFAASGESVCQARRQLCQRIKAGNPSLKTLSRDPDDHRYLCKAQ